MADDDRTASPGGARLFRHTLVVMAGVAAGLIAWQLSHLLLLLFASILAALMFHDFAAALQRWLKLPFAVALTLAVILPLVIIIVIFGLFGNLMVDQFTALTQQFPAALASARTWLRTTEIGREVISGLDGYAPEVGTVVGIVRATLSNLGTGVSELAIVLVGGVYLGAQPGLYANGIIHAAERAGFPRTRQVADRLHNALIAWLKGQAVGMAFVAIGTSIGLSLVGLPSAVAIGLVAGLCEFVPYLGVILVSVPSVIIGFSLGIKTGVFTIIALVVVQQLQGNVVTPMAQGKFADLPPALTIFSLIAFAVLLGPLGIILAVPMTVVGMVLVRVALEPRAPSESGPPAVGHR
ncbi:AI-2E family transporter [Sandarakinorhabdus sp. DWP1-3-1]|uniref:AI-2E family transporter n=1 Tax=Sandarakinorhabdus sp. DWP1-3-1 TaxID=2804627 RepID=UPI003CE84C1B